MVKPFIVAEMSANHLGSLDRAMRIVDAAAEAGADAIKLQTFDPIQMVDPLKIIESGPWAGQRAITLYKQAHTPRDWHRPIFDHAKRLGLIAFSSAFHPDDVQFLEWLGCPIYKISSFELTDIDLIRCAAKTGKALIISTGMGSKVEIGLAIGTVFNTRPTADLTVLKCTSAYPADARDANLATLYDMRERWPYCGFGLSDHTPGTAVAVAAVALGADVIEKHLTLSRADGGPDAAFSMDPAEFAQLVTECRRAAAAIGEVRYGPTPAEASSMQLRRVSGGKRGS